jgi:hypothetical protein
VSCNLNAFTNKFTSISFFNSLIYISTLLLCLFLYGHSDLSHTYNASYAFLNGHFLDFYSYNSKHCFDTIYQGKNDYLPIIYLFFSIWNLPLYFLGLVSNPEIDGCLVTTPIEIIWSKLLLVLFFYLCALLIEQISDIVSVKKSNISLPKVLFLTSPIIIFVVFIFSQYDIFGLFFVLLGLKYFLKKNIKLFLLFFSIAISFKYFAIVLFLPLIILIEKNLIKLLVYLLLASSFTFAQIALFWEDDIFRQSFFALATHKLSGGFSNLNILHSRAIYIGLLLLFSTIYLYFKDYKKSSIHIFHRDILLIPIIFYSLLFLLVSPHPQWYILPLAFFPLISVFIRNKMLFYSMDILGFLAFVWICVNRWPNNIDYSMINNGSLKNFFSNPIFLGNFLMPKLMVPLFTIFFCFYIFSPLCYNKNEEFKFNMIPYNLLTFRYISIYIFIIPSLLSIYFI